MLQKVIFNLKNLSNEWLLTSGLDCDPLQEQQKKWPYLKKEFPVFLGRPDVAVLPQYGTDGTALRNCLGAGSSEQDKQVAVSLAAPSGAGKTHSVTSLAVGPADN